MHLLFLIDSLGGGGAERVLVNLVNNMDLSRYDITIQTIFKAGVNRGMLRSAIHIIESNMSRFHGVSRFFKLLPAALLYHHFIKEHYDMVVAFSHGVATKILQAAPKNTGKIAWLHTDMRHSSLPNVFFHRQIVPAFDKFDKIVGVAKEVSQSFIKMYGLESKVVTCYNTNDVPRIQQLSSESICINGWSDWHEGLRLVTLGRLDPVKGYDRLIDICNHLKTEGFLFRLLILGSGAEEKNLLELRKNLGLENEVYFGGYQENPFPFLKAADLFVCSSRQEGLNTAMSEAIILGTPVISTSVSGATEVLGENSDYGLLVENNDNALYEGLKKLLSSQELLTHYRGKAKERAVFFDTNTTVKAVEDLIDEVVACHK